MKKNMSWKFTDELSVTFQSSVSGAGEFGLSIMYQYMYYLDLRITRIRTVRSDLTQHDKNLKIKTRKDRNQNHKSPKYSNLCKI